MDIMDRLKGPRRNLPIGIQSFERLRRDGYLYVDKTAFVYELASTGNPYFLSRPRRFGKSLLISTLEAYFQGKRELFVGLAMEKLVNFKLSLPMIPVCPQPAENSTWSFALEMRS